MKLFKIYGDYDHYDTCDIHIPHGVPLSLCSVDLDGSIQGEKWLPRIMIRAKKHPLGDYVNCHLGNVLVLTDEAIEKLLPVMGNFEKLQLFSNACRQPHLMHHKATKARFLPPRDTNR